MLDLFLPYFITGYVQEWLGVTAGVAWIITLSSSLAAGLAMGIACSVVDRKLASR